MISHDTGQSEALWLSTPEFEVLPTARAAAACREWAARCDRWIGQRWKMFDPFAWSGVDERYQRRKAFAEAAIYMHVADALRVPGVSAELRDLLVERVNSTSFAELVQRHPRHFLLYSSPIAYVSSLGQLGAQARSATDRVLAGRGLWAAERLPHRQMDLWNFCGLYGCGRERMDLSSILSQSCLRFQPDPIDCTLREAYALTHDLLFLHNFGVPHPAFPAPPSGWSSADLYESLLLRYMVEGNADIALELLMVGVAERVVSTPLACLTISWIIDRAERLGFVEGPRFAGGARRATADPVFDEWENHYHTNLVAASALRAVATALEESASPDADIGAPPIDAASAFRLGQVVVSLAGYNLPMAAARFEQAHGDPSSTQCPAAWCAVVEYLRHQSGDGTRFGFWCDERAVYEQRSGPDDPTFDQVIVEPVSSLCARVTGAAHGA